MMSSPMGWNDSWPASPQSLSGLRNGRGLHGDICLGVKLGEKICVRTGVSAGGASIQGLQHG